MPTPLLTFREVCDRLRLSDKTVRKLLVSGDLNGKRTGRQWRIAEEDLEQYLSGPSVRVSA